MTNILGQQRTEYKNALDDTVRVVDHIGGEVSFGYDAVGNLLTTNGALPDDDDLTTLQYNRLGQKTAMQDPDKGNWSYRYNSLGELICQIDAEGNAIRQHYDSQGRLQRRDDILNTQLDTAACAALSGQITPYTVWQFVPAGGDGYGQLQGSEQVGFDQDTQLQTTEIIVSYSYDSFGRVAVKQTRIDGINHYERTTYDEVGRLFQQFAAHRHPDSPLGQRYHYNARGYAYAVSESAATTGAVPEDCSGSGYYQCTRATDAYGNVTWELQFDGNNKTRTLRSFDLLTGRQTGQESTDTSGILLHQSAYRFDVAGNLTGRASIGEQRMGVAEVFAYDGINRLTHGYQQVISATDVTGYAFPDASGGAPSGYTLSHQYTHDAAGNLLSKREPNQQGSSDTVNMIYGYQPECADLSVGPHAVCQTAPGQTYQYDQNGNNISGGARMIDYTVFNKPWQISTDSGSVTRFWYGAERQRIKRTDTDTGRVQYYLGNTEILRDNGTTIYRRSIAGIVIRFVPSVSQAIDDSEQTTLLTDHLGSTIAYVLPDQTIQHQAFTPFGTGLDVNLSPVGLLNQLLHQWSERGFTGHETITSVGIIHMNGRIYDPTLGRFLQADPFVQDPDNSQSLNRYSYVLNNPLSYTDPSGYFLSGLFYTLVNVVGCSFGPIACGIVVAVTSLLQGATIQQALFNGVVAGVSAYAFGQLGGYTQANGTHWALQIGAHAVAGGAFAEIRGGDFAQGALTSGLSKGFSLSGEGYLEELDTTTGVLDNVLVGLVGGTISEISGGDFVNGATSAAIAYTFNQESQRKPGGNVGSVDSGLRKLEEFYEDVVELFGGELEEPQSYQEFLATRAERGGIVDTFARGVGGFGQVLFGAGLCETGFGCAMGSTIAAQGVSNVSSAFGGPHFVNDGVSFSLTALGVDNTTAGNIANGVSLGIDFGSASGAFVKDFIQLNASPAYQLSVSQSLLITNDVIVIGRDFGVNFGDF